MTQQTVKKNIILFYIYEFARGSLMCVPYMVPFWKSNAFDMTMIMILQAFFSICVVLFEVPSGYIADRLGSKLTLLAGGILVTGGFAFYSFLNSFWIFMIAEAIIALGISLTSGADSAFLWETLSGTKEEDDYQKIFGRGHFITLLAIALACIAGSFVSQISIRATIFLSAPVLAFMIISSLFMSDPVKGKNQDPKLKDKKADIKDFIITVKELPWKKILPIIIPYGLLFTAIASVVWLYADFFKSCGWELNAYGFIFAGFNIVAGICSTQSHRIEKKLGLFGAPILLACQVLFGTAAMVFFRFPAAIFFCLGTQFSRGISQVVFTDALNKQVSSENRATAISVMNLAGRLGYSLLIPFIGMISDSMGLTAALLALTCFAIMSLIMIISSSKMKEPIKEAG